MKIGWNVELRFQISLHEKDKALLEQIKNYFGVGNIYKAGPQSIKFCVLSIEDLSVIISHFDRYPLHTQKQADYELFKQAWDLILNKEHLTEEGLRKIVAIKASSNLGLSEQLKTAFPDITPMDRPLVTNPKIKDPHWLAGFTNGDGYFGVEIRKSNTSKTGCQVFLQFEISQHNRDELLLRSFIEYFKCGRVYKHSENAIVFKVSKILTFYWKIYSLLSEISCPWCKV